MVPFLAVLVSCHFSELQRLVEGVREMSGLLGGCSGDTQLE